MHRTNLSLFISALGCVLFLHSSTAGPLSSAQVTKIINRVSVIDPVKGGHPAAIRDVIKDDLGLQTGERSRSELLFQDNTLTRIGAETFFSFKAGTRDLTLEKGSMLLQVPKGLGGAKIHTAAVTAAITGTTIMMEYVPRSYIKVLVLEGSLRLSRNGNFGDSLLLHPGKMVIMRPDAKKIPDPIDVNLELIVKTSTLVNFPGNAPLPSMGLIQAAIDEQKKQLAKGHLVPTNLVMGHGTNVIFASNAQLAKILLPISSSGVTNAATSSNLRGVSSTLPSVGSVANTTTGVTSGLPAMGSIANTVTNVTNGLPAVGSVTNTATSATTSINNLLGSGGVVGQTTNNLLGGSSSATAVSVSNSTQILGLLNNVASTSGGIVTITPTAANVVPTAATAVVQSTPVGTVNTTSTAPATNVLNTVGSAPTTGILPNQAVTTSQLLRGGH